MKQTFEIEVPEDWEIDNLTYSGNSYYPGCVVHFKKKKPRRRVFEETGACRQVTYGDLYETATGDIRTWKLENHSEGEFLIFKEITEYEEH